MTAAVEVLMPSQLRELYAIMCALNRPSDPLLLFNGFEQNLLKDYIRNGSLYEDYRNGALNVIQ